MITLSLKKAFNQVMLEKENQIKKQIRQSGDSLLSALQYAMAGNFIDMHAVNDIRPEDLDRVLNSAPTLTVDETLYRAFRKELSHAKSMVYLHDNAGEIVMDKLFLKVIKSLYPDLVVTSVVRGMPVVNDATMQDAEKIGLCDIVGVIENGTDIPGTQLDCVNAQTLKAINNANIIISKGQGNFETLYGCGKNIYYIFLCKCDLFVKRFGLPRFSGVFANENSLKFKKQEI